MSELSISLSLFFFSIPDGIYVPSGILYCLIAVSYTHLVVENHFNCPYYLRVEVDINNFIFGGNDLKIEEFKDITIAYMRNIGEYGRQNEKLMEDFKEFLRKNKLFTEETTILGIALDNPAFTPTNRLRYDVGLIIDKKSEINLATRKIDDGKYAIFEVSHTKPVSYTHLAI